MKRTLTILTALLQSPSPAPMNFQRLITIILQNFNNVELTAK